MNYIQPFRGDYPITQRYGEVIEGVTYKNKPHTGIDYGCPEGTEILASADGVVKYAEFDNTGYGNTIILRHSDGTATLYAHLQLIFVKVNETVKQGHVIGLSGKTGNATGPHLHFEARSVWCEWRSHFNPMQLPLMSFYDQQVTGKLALKGADSFQAGDLVKITAPLGAKGFYSEAFDGYSTYQQGQAFYYTGDNTIRKSNGLTYMRVVPASFSVWVAVNNGDIQLLDK